MFENDFSSGADGDISGGNCCGQMSEDELTHVPADQRRLRKRWDDVKRLETVQDFLIKSDIKPLMHLLKISIFKLALSLPEERSF